MANPSEIVRCRKCKSSLLGSYLTALADGYCDRCYFEHNAKYTGQYCKGCGYIHRDQPNLVLYKDVCEGCYRAGRFEKSPVTESDIKNYYIYLFK